MDFRSLTHRVQDVNLINLLGRLRLRVLKINYKSSKLAKFASKL